VVAVEPLDIDQALVGAQHAALVAEAAERLAGLDVPGPRGVIEPDQQPVLVARAVLGQRQPALQRVHRQHGGEEGQADQPEPEHLGIA
jgi:hypothetical protein